MNKFQVKKAQLEVIEGFFNHAENMKESIGQDFTIIGKEPKRKYNEDTKQYEDVIDEETGEIVMTDKWGYVDKDELSEEDEAKIEMIDSIIAYLEKLI